MGNTKNNNSSSGIGFAGLLAVAFIVLKLTDTINWSWLWVLSPLWLIPAIVILFFIVFRVILGGGNKKRK